MVPMNAVGRVRHDTWTYATCGHCNAAPKVTARVTVFSAMIENIAIGVVQFAFVVCWAGSQVRDTSRDGDINGGWQDFERPIKGSVNILPE